MHPSYTPQYTTPNRNVHISVRNGVMWDMGQVHYGIYEIWSIMIEYSLTVLDL